MFTNKDLAILDYDTPEFRVVRAGRYVLCAVTGQQIPLEELKYWSGEFQEAYIDADASARAIIAGGARNLKQA
ncbi:MAG TPA: DUF2093 domain-containing protein [Sphingopyxis sp.]|nr:DUF2093 domain-containing protein [Sphingopyxis sp.]